MLAACSVCEALVVYLWQVCDCVRVKFLQLLKTKEQVPCVGFWRVCTYHISAFCFCVVQIIWLLCGADSSWQMLMCCQSVVHSCSTCFSWTHNLTIPLQANWGLSPSEIYRSCLREEEADNTVQEAEEDTKQVAVSIQCVFWLPAWCTCTAMLVVVT